MQEISKPKKSCPPRAQEHLRKKHCRKALDVLCGKSELEDLQRIRKALKSGFFDYSRADVEYLSKRGEWQDIDLLIKVVERPEPGVGLLSIPSDEKYKFVARCILRIAGRRVGELLSLKMSDLLLSHVIVQTSDLLFKEVENDVVAQLLISEGERVRKATALKCVKAFSQKRVRRVLANHVQGGRRYFYNVVHWLDMGISLPKTRSSMAVRQEIEKVWSS